MRRALVVDDSRAMRLILARAITRLGFDVDEAAHGREALERLALGSVDLVLIDWNMPIMNGFELVKAIRDEPLFAAMRIVMVTTDNDLDHVEKALLAGADDFVVKPFTPDGLRDKLLMLGFYPKYAPEDYRS